MSFTFKAGGVLVGLTAMMMSASSADARDRRGAIQGAKSAHQLAAQHWDLVAWSGRKLPQGKPLRLDFDLVRGQFSSSTGCNRAAGAYRVMDNAIRFGDGKSGFATTLMACPGDAMAVERAYTGRLSSVTRYTLAGDRLVLRTAKGETLMYQAAHKPAANAPRKFIYVSAETRPCTGVGPMTCLQIREKESDPWELFYGGIVDFQPEPGIEYRLRIIEEKVANPPADGSSIRWTLDQVVEQRVVKP
ncbi:META and DUF4377 domain-containing protein [Sphingomonas sp. ERG5]|uniref:META and DUF4377 domain-containing protein n=1 Tax=Sphingomonas sp. ERG5 TaxID=1381597 RepID=UPI00054C0608|nr:META and DUF4377 domain-containing protein [Sphingomonas sp. ERG5]